jgi:large subunit ribosomal protein L3
MTRIYDEKGAIVPVTVVQAGPCNVTQVKTVESDGYNAVQIGFGDCKAKFSTFPMIGHTAKAGVGPRRHFREIKLKDATDKALGDVVDASIFEGVEYVDVVGTSKGKGFQGVVKRHHFRGGRSSHGSMFHRAPGSIGGSSFPSRVYPGMRGTGRMGGDRVTVKNLLVVKIDEDKNLLYVRGAVPGGPNGYVTIQRAKRG